VKDNYWTISANRQIKVWFSEVNVLLKGVETLQKKAKGREQGLASRMEKRRKILLI
jgi:hypothetical protein